jgi:hypothetical protein
MEWASESETEKGSWLPQQLVAIEEESSVLERLVMMSILPCVFHTLHGCTFCACSPRLSSSPPSLQLFPPPLPFIPPCRHPLDVENNST